MKYGLKIDFKNKPQLVNVPKIPHSAEEKSIRNLEINYLLKKGVITKCQREQDDFISTVSQGKRRMAHFVQSEQDDFISTVFTREKKDGTFRTILNLKYLNEFVE